jgi:glutamate-1-semialdehyde 2,1-aminomutase
MARRVYRNSEAHLERAERVIPLASQTFSKSRVQFPVGAAPLFITRGKGARVWDVDENEYVDFINGLAAVNLGYADPDMNAAIEAQLQAGTIFSLPHPLECEVAELLVEMVPCAEMVRFGKNGSDATTAAIRLARACTSRDRVAVCGYHGWQDWYIGSTSRSLGVPEAVRELTHPFPYDDCNALAELLNQYPGEFAAVILEPVNSQEPGEGYLNSVREVTHQQGALLIFDETITGFRVARGGAQELYGVAPDLATFGKGMANGMPLSAVVGSAEYMRKMEDIFFSTTFGGETLSLAAAKAVLTKIKNAPVIERLNDLGKRLKQKLVNVIHTHQLQNILQLSGLPAWTFLTITKKERDVSMAIRAYLIQELCGRGFLSIGTHNISFAHTEDDVDRLCDAYDEILPKLCLALKEDELTNSLKGKPLSPIFSIR